MTNSESKERKNPIWLLLVIPPLLFLLKDIIATIIVLSYEPGITERAVNNYAVELLPATLFVETGRAISLNVGLGLIIGAFSYLVALYRRRQRHHRAAQQIIGPERR